MHALTRALLPSPYTLTCLLVCALQTVGCHEPAPSAVTQAFELRALTQRGEPVAAVRVWVDGALAGESKHEGLVSGTLHGPVGQHVRVSWACPATHAPATAQRDLILRQVAGDAGRLALEARCEPIERTAALVVRAQGAPATGLPVHVRGQEVARTDDHGVAHVLLRARPGAPITVALDTSAHPDLLPASPTQTFQIGQQDAVLLLDRTLALRPRPKRLAPVRAREPDASPIHKPLRIQ